LEALLSDDQTCELRLSLVNGDHLPPVLRLPNHFTIECDPAMATIEVIGKLIPDHRLQA
jgi:hypothetical protein